MPVLPERVLKYPGWKRCWPLLVAFASGLTILTFPPVGTDLGVNGDISLASVLSYAHQHHLQFGSDLVYTYGPLGFLVMFYYTPYLAGIRMLVDVLVCLTSAFGCCLLAWRISSSWRWPLLAAFVFGTANLEPRIDLVLEIAFLSWGLLGFIEEGEWGLPIVLLVFSAFAAFCALAKSSFLVLAPCAILMLAGDLVVRRRFKLGALLPGAFVAMVLAGWLASGQSLSNLYGFLIKSFAVIEGYNAALAWEGLQGGVRYAGFAVFALAAALLVLRILFSFNPKHRGHLRRTLLLAWLGMLVFAVWKHSFVREDFRHPAFLFAFVPVFALSLSVLSGPQGRYSGWIAGLTGVLCLISLGALQAHFLPAFTAALTNPARVAWHNLKALAWPPAYLHEQSRMFEASRQQAALPAFKKIVDSASVDCFGYFQSWLLYNELTYHPAPVFQSYAACNGRLARLNEQFYLSGSGPDYVMFCLAAVDRKFPALEDARVLRALLINYQLVAKERFFLLLKRRSNVIPTATLLSEVRVSLSETVDLRPYAGRNLWLEIELEPSWLGRLRSWLFRPGTVRLAAWREPGKGLLLRRRAPPAGLAAGFIASPLLSRTEDVAALYANELPEHPGAYTLEVQPGESCWWQRNANVRVYAIADALGSESFSAE